MLIVVCVLVLRVGCREVFVSVRALSGMSYHSMASLCVSVHYVRACVVQVTVATAMSPEEDGVPLGRFNVTAAQLQELIRIGA